MISNKANGPEGKQCGLGASLGRGLDHARVGVDNIVGQVDQELGQAPLRRRVVSQHGRKRSISQRLRQTLAESFSGSRVVAQPTETQVSQRARLVVSQEHSPGA